MGKLVPPLLLNHYGKSTTTVCTCWKVERTDGVVKGFTNGTRSLPVDGVLYVARTGFDASQISTKMGLQVDNLEVSGPQDDTSLTLGSILSGVWDFAFVTVFEVNYKDISMGINIVRTGWLGDLSAGTLPFTAELRGLMQMLQVHIGRIVQPPCDVDLGDSKCTVDLETFPSGKFTGTVDSVVSGLHFQDAGLVMPAAGWWNGGYLLVNSGQNTGRKRDVRLANTPDIYLQLPFPFPLTTGDSYSIYTFCDKSNVMCNDKFNNILNDRGFPFSPNMMDTVGS